MVGPVPRRGGVEVFGNGQKSNKYGLMNLCAKIYNGTQKWSIFSLRSPTIGRGSSYSIRNIDNDTMSKYSFSFLNNIQTQPAEFAYTSKKRYLVIITIELRPVK